MMYQGSFEEPVQLESTKYPIYKQILDMEAVDQLLLITVVQF